LTIADNLYCKTSGSMSVSGQRSLTDFRNYFEIFLFQGDLALATF